MGLASLRYFAYYFSKKKKCFSSCILLNDLISLTDFLYFLRYWPNMIIIITDYLVCEVINFVINLSFLIKQSFYLTKKSGQKFQIRSLSVPGISCCTRPHASISFARLKKFSATFNLFFSPWRLMPLK